MNVNEAGQEIEEIIIDGTETDTEMGEEAGEVAEDAEVIVSLGEEAPPPEETERAPEWVRELRKKHRETVKELEATKRELASHSSASKPVEIGKKPTLDDYEYDADKFEEALTAWHDRKRRADDAAENAKKAEQAQQAEWQATLDGYAKLKSELKVSDFEEAEDEARSTFSDTQRGIIIQGAKNSAALMYALGKDHDQAQKFAAIKDPVKFAFAIAALETTMKITPRKPVPSPERQVSGTGRVAGSTDSHLERLRAEAEKTGDYTKVSAYKTQKRNQK